MGSLYDLQFSSVQSLSHVWLFATPWTAAHQASLSITNSWSLLKFMTIQSVTPSNHLILSPPSPPAFNLSHHQGLFKWNGYIFPFLLCFSLLFFSQLFVRPPQRPTILPFCISFSWSLPPVQCHEPLSVVLQALCLSDLYDLSVPWLPCLLCSRVLWVLDGKPAGAWGRGERHKAFLWQWLPLKQH